MVLCVWVFQLGDNFYRVMHINEYGQLYYH